MIMVEKTLESSLGYRAILRLGKWDKDLSLFRQEELNGLSILGEKID